MRAAHLENTLEAMIKLRRPVLIEGSPGLGKTQIPQAVARKLWGGDEHLLHLHGPTLQPEDLALPSANTTKTAIDFLINGRFPVVGSDHPDMGLIVIDELAQGDNSIQKTMANMIQEREMYGRKLKPGWAIVATGNKQSDRAGANRILSHLSNRMTRITLEAHLDDWCNWALANDIRPEVISFLRFKPNMIMDFDPNQDSNPTPRAWSEGVSPVLDNVPAQAEFECVAGAVGTGAASEFMSFMAIARKLPNPDVVLMSPQTHEVPSEPSVLYALSGALGARATPDNFERVMMFAERMPPEFMVLTVRDAVRRSPEVSDTKAFIRWSSGAGADVLM